MEWLKTNIFHKGLSTEIKVEDTNGLIFNNVPLPEEIILMIFNYLDISTVLKCKEVCKNWNHLLKSHHFWRQKLSEKSLTIKNKHPWYFYYAAYKLHEKNFLQNGNGQQQFEHWKNKQNGGDGWKIENVPHGAEELPDQPEFNQHKSCFATSYVPCKKGQIIYLKQNNLLRELLDQVQPVIYISEWFAGRFDCGCIYKLGVKLYNYKNTVIYEKEVTKKVDQWSGSAWEKVEILCEKYGKGLTAIEFYHEGCDTQFWAGHYGSKMAGGVVKIKIDFI